MKIFILFISILFLVSCTSVKVFYNNDISYQDIYPNDRTLKVLKAEGNGTTIIFLTSGFEKDVAKISNSTTVFLDESRINSGWIGLGCYKVVKNDENITVKFSNVSLHLVKEDLQKYKYVYIKKKDKDYSVEFTNKPKVFL